MSNCYYRNKGESCPTVTIETRVNGEGLYSYKDQQCIILSYMKGSELYWSNSKSHDLHRNAIKLTYPMNIRLKNRNFNIFSSS